MQVAIAGASGVLGRSTIRLLHMRGHEIVGLVRNPEKAHLIESLGARAVIGDIFDARQVSDFTQGSAAVLHLATAIPIKPRTTLADWTTNDHLRREGTRNLIEACRGRPVRAYIQQSIALVYGDLAEGWADERSPTRPNAITQSAVDGEGIVLAAHREWGLPAAVLRGAMFYHAEAWHTRYFIDQLKRRRLPILGGGNNYWHYIHADDMARAIACALENPDAAAGQIFNVADDQPFRARELLNYLAGELGLAPPLQIPLWLARWLAGLISVNMLTRSARYRTEKIKTVLNWSPQYPTYKEGFSDILSKLTV